MHLLLCECRDVLAHTEMEGFWAGYNIFDEIETLRLADYEGMNQDELQNLFKMEREKWKK